MPNTPEGPSAPAPGSQTPSMAFTAHKPARLPLFRPKGRGCDDACSGFTHVTDRTVAPAPLRTRPLDHARGHSYQGPRHLPGPDSHRPAVLNLSLDLRHDELLLLTTPKQSGRTCATPSPGEASVSHVGARTSARRRGCCTKLSAKTRPALAVTVADRAHSPAGGQGAPRASDDLRLF
jgi:hypothetical protein